jgi:hypothetical protein
MSARVYFRPRTTTRRKVLYAFTLISSPFVVMTLNSLLSRPGPVRADDPNMIKLIEKKIELTMQDPSLDEPLKSRITKRLYAMIDFRAACNDAFQSRKKLAAASQQAARMDAEAKSRYLRGTVAGLVQEHLAREREKSRLNWQVCKLVLFAPWREAGVCERVVNLSALIVVDGVVSPLVRFQLGRLYKSCCNS